jgi:hypothetical protein
MGLMGKLWLGDLARPENDVARQKSAIGDFDSNRPTYFLRSTTPNAYFPVCGISLL